jgi:hypothetical protein
MNAQELIEITRRVNDPDEGLRLMAVDNREAGQQTHREVVRRVHNFVASALTLVEHTRIFMRENYCSTPVLDRYQAKIDADLANDPLARFVQDLRNYMLHKGLPNSEMHMKFESNPDLPGGGTLETGIQIRAARLQEWDGWSVSARGFIEACGESIDIRTVAETYADKISLFHTWLQRELDQFHSDDLNELRALQDSMNQQEAAANPAPTAPLTMTDASREGVDECEQDFSFAPSRAATLDAAATALLSKVRKIELEAAKRDDGFASERPPGPTITEQDMLSVPRLWGPDIAGRRVFVFIHKDGARFGLDEEVFTEMQVLAESVFKSDWARRTLSRGFIEETMIKWLQSSFQAEHASTLSGTIAKDGREAVRPQELWAPIAHLEVQTPFAVGPAEVATITKAMIDGLEVEALNLASEQREKAAQFF